MQWNGAGKDKDEDKDCLIPEVGTDSKNDLDPV